MSRIGRITSGQLFVMFFVSRIIVTMTYSPALSNGDTLWDHLISVFISFILTFILLIPILCLKSKYRSLSVLDLSVMRFGVVGSILNIFYGLYFAFVAVYTLTSYGIFLDNVIDEPIPSALILTAVVITACYGAYKGVEALARFSGIVLVGLLLTLAFMMFALVPSVKPENYSSVSYVNGTQIYNGIMLMMSRMSCVPALGVLYPIAKGNIFRSAAKWNIALFLTMFSLIVMLTGAMGDYLSVQLFPIYEAATAGEFGIFRRLDAFYIGMWTAGLFVKVALFLYLSARSFAKSFHNRTERRWIFPFAFVILVSSLIFKMFDFNSILFDKNFWIAITLLTAAAIPLVLLICRLKVKRKQLVSILLIVACLLGMGSMSGCSAVQLSEKLIIQGLGVDYDTDGCHLTMIVLDTEKGNEDEVTKLMYSDGKTITEAFANAENAYGQEIMLSHNLFIIMNETAAQNCNEVIAYFRNNPEARDTVALFIEKDSAGAFISKTIEEFQYSAESIFSLSMNGIKGEENLQCTIVDFVSQTGVKDACIPVVKAGEAYATIIGAGVFKNNQLKGYLNIKEVQGFLLSTGNASGLTADVITENKQSVSYHIKSEACTIQALAENEQVAFMLDIQIVLDSHFSPENVSLVRHAVEEDVQAVIKKSLREYGCDIFGFKQTLKNAHPSFYKAHDNIDDFIQISDIKINCTITVE
ncbi:MAG: GerAB/ArcD/ProY family transporter [Acutalibacteraceae bacterium]